MLVQIRFDPLDELRNGTLREGREDGHACMSADNRKLRVPAIASVTICGTLRANNFRKRWHQPFFHLAKNGDRTFDLLQNPMQSIADIESKRPQLEQEFRERERETSRKRNRITPTVQPGVITEQRFLHHMV